MEKCAIFIDEGHWRKTLQDFGSIKADLRRLSLFLADGCPILRTYYYGCMPYLSNHPTEDELRVYDKKEKYIKAVSALERFTIRMGRLAYRGRNEFGHPIYIQKCVDVLMACDLVMLATKGIISKAILLTCDGDYQPAIAIAKNEGVDIKLCYGSGGCPHENLLGLADEVQKIDEHLLKTIRIQ